MAAGCIRRAPHAPNPPALATVIDSDGGEALAIGAKRIGRVKPKRPQKASTFLIIGFMVSSPKPALS
jgi:hypothetical protein